MAELTFEAAEKRINEIAEELADGNSKSKSKSIIELRRLCGRHRTVPASYKLVGVEKQGDCPQCISPVAQIWKGRYNNEVVAVKILITPQPQEDPSHKTRGRFCKEVVLMKQLDHDNILPFYGVSTSLANFCLVYPWYENGKIMDYLKKNPDANRFKLLSDAASGLCYLHNNRLVHGALRPSHILIDEGGNARLSTAGRSSIVAVKGTSIASHVQSGGEIDNYRYSAPEIQWTEADEILITKESDVYGMAMVIYEVLTGDMPYSECKDLAVLSKIEAGEMPRRPPNGIADPVWDFLEMCWSRDPTKRPSITHVRNALSQSPSFPPPSPSLPPRTPEERPTVGELPGNLKVQSVKISFNEPKQRKFYVKFKYGDKSHMTSRTAKTAASDEHTWNAPETWLIETNEQNPGRPVTFEVFRTRTSMLRKDKICATGKFSLQNNVNKQISVKLDAPDCTGPAVLEIALTEV